MNTLTEEKRNIRLYDKEGKERRNTLCLMRRQVEVGVYQTKIPKRVLRTCVASRRNERGLGIHEETALPSPWQWRFEVDTMQSRFVSNVDMGHVSRRGFGRR